MPAAPKEIPALSPAQLRTVSDYLAEGWGFAPLSRLLARKWGAELTAAGLRAAWEAEQVRLRGEHTEARRRDAEYFAVYLEPDSTEN